MNKYLKNRLQHQNTHNVKRLLKLGLVSLAVVGGSSAVVFTSPNTVYGMDATATDDTGTTDPDNGGTTDTTPPTDDTGTTNPDNGGTTDTTPPTVTPEQQALIDEITALSEALKKVDESDPKFGEINNIRIKLGHNLEFLNAGEDLSDDQLNYITRGKKLLEEYNNSTSKPTVTPEQQTLINEITALSEALKKVDESHPKFGEINNIRIKLGHNLEFLNAGEDLSDDQLNYITRGKKLLEEYNNSTSKPTVTPEQQTLINEITALSEALKKVDESHPKFGEINNIRIKLGHNLEFLNAGEDLSDDQLNYITRGKKLLEEYNNSGAVNTDNTTTDTNIVATKQQNATKPTAQQLPNTGEQTLFSAAALTILASVGLIATRKKQNN
ncbi:MAG: LPXTG cell wall anchor domain-containing protein [Aerococcaceae bacterium]|nr:LPXTG cell wall anchor domain-containing protein [Aerococcaceae bacterium]